MLRIYTMKYITMNDIRAITHKNSYEYQFTSEVLPGEYVFFDTNDWEYEHLRYDIEVLNNDNNQDEYFNRIKNDFELMTILRKEYNILEGIFIYMN